MWHYTQEDAELTYSLCSCWRRLGQPGAPNSPCLFSRERCYWYNILTKRRYPHGWLAAMRSRRVRTLSRNTKQNRSGVTVEKAIRSGRELTEEPDRDRRTWAPPLWSRCSSPRTALEA